MKKNYGEYEKVINQIEEKRHAAMAARVRGDCMAATALSQDIFHLERERDRLVLQGAEVTDEPGQA